MTCINGRRGKISQGEIISIIRLKTEWKRWDGGWGGGAELEWGSRKGPTRTNRPNYRAMGSKRIAGRYSSRAPASANYKKGQEAGS